ncbi:MAG: hypothetical protein QM803_20110 [Rhodocyclaceae bacterium]
MKRRGFLQLAGASLAFGMAPRLAFAATAPASPASVDGRLLVLVELKGGNDGLNTLIPYRDPTYYALRPQIGIKPEGMIRLDDRVALHRALEPLMPSWEEGRLAIIQGVGYPQPNLSHFRSIEIWDTASRSDQYLSAGWLTRLFRDNPLPARYAADALVLGSADLGPVAGGARAIALDNPGQFNKQAKLVQAMAGQGDNALGHVLKVESDIATAARSLGTGGKLFNSVSRAQLWATVPCGVRNACIGQRCGCCASDAWQFRHAPESGWHACQSADSTDRGLVRF